MQEGTSEEPAFQMLRSCLGIRREWNMSRTTTIDLQGSIPPETNQQMNIADKLVRSREQIARLAYAYWQQRGKPLGSADEDWFRAECDLRVLKGVSKLQSKTAHRVRLALMESELET
jgi:hypothetical protein